MTLRNHQQLPFLVCLFVTLVGLLLITWPRNTPTVIVSSSQQQPTTALPHMILEVGLPRSGSLAIHQFFACQMARSRHYCCDSSSKTQFPCNERTIGETIHHNAVNEQPLLQNCGDDETTRVFTAMHVESSEPYGYFLPQHFALPLFVKDYPDAVWILPLRHDAATWATSVLHWHSETQRFLASFGLRKETRIAPANDQEASRITKGLQAAVQHAYDPQTHLEKKQQLMSIYDRHTQKVRTLAQQHHIRLVEINIDDPHAGERLQTEFPSFNSDCWSFDPATLDDDWKNLTLPF
ncbi:hypothetical protein FisN_7Hu377 [Fistulifera solaris]|uniref:Sulfotransferase domain-containing protein n=1 Tax=Fistulifera solaris TaxID=1519565 RepID=A0A1Z5KSR0_FISSO|nr:hypothetical protein FisN_7Hu377 [Fistulifera solaris]|eukprot:GAX29031.1 hypothetical protein FisN_7Hu377 [Fistulifera solaris]